MFVSSAFPWACCGVLGEHRTHPVSPGVWQEACRLLAPPALLPPQSVASPILLRSARQLPAWLPVPVWSKTTSLRNPTDQMSVPVREQGAALAKKRSKFTGIDRKISLTAPLPSKRFSVFCIVYSFAPHSYVRLEPNAHVADGSQFWSVLTPACTSFVLPPVAGGLAGTGVMTWRGVILDLSRQRQTLPHRSMVRTRKTCREIIDARLLIINPRRLKNQDIKNKQDTSQHCCQADQVCARSPMHDPDLLKRFWIVANLKKETSVRHIRKALTANSVHVPTAARVAAIDGPTISGNLPQQMASV